MEARKFKLSYFPRTARYLHSVKSVDTPAIGTFISTPHAKMTPDPPPIALTDIGGRGVQFHHSFFLHFYLCVELPFRVSFVSLTLVDLHFMDIWRLAVGAKIGVNGQK